MEVRPAEITVAGHICLDIIPAIRTSAGSLTELLVPGKLIDVGPAVMSTGGAVSNTGLALTRLGIPTRLMGKIGDDLFGKAILELLIHNGRRLADGMIVAPGEMSSYSVVISPPDVDRVFLHCTGTNDTFAFADLNLNEIAETRLFHFGYPPLMKRMYEGDGAELAELLASVKKLGVTVTLDMAKPDPKSPAGQADWAGILQRVLPHVDFFFPSFEEIWFMLYRNEYERSLAEAPHEDILRHATPELLARLSGSLLAMGAAAVMIKLGEHGVYMRTSPDPSRWLQTGKCMPLQMEGWLGRELLGPCFQVESVGTTGAGDCTISGFLAGIVKGLTLEETVTAAVAVGACCVERSDATSGIPEWKQVQIRLAQGWERRPVKLMLERWERNESNGLLFGPHDRGRLSHDHEK